jgi:putative flippase GtrA
MKRFMSVQLRGEMLRFLFSGLMTLVICLTSMWLFVGVAGINEMISVNLSAAVGYVCSYILNKNVVFRKTDRRHLVYGSRFIFLQAVLLIINNAVFYAGLHWAGWHYLVVSCVNAVLMSGFNFVLLKLMVFI